MKEHNTTGRELMESRWDGDLWIQCNDCESYHIDIRGEKCLSKDERKGKDMPCQAFTPIAVNLRKYVLEAWELKSSQTDRG